MTDDRLVIEEDDRSVIVTPTDDEVIGSQENLVVVTQDLLEYVVDHTSINIPSGGDEGQLLAKDSDTDYDVIWVDAPIGGGGSYVRQTYTTTLTIPAGTGIDITLVGNIYPYDPAQAWRAPPTGDYQTSINTDNSVNAIVVTTSGDSGGNSGGVLWP